MTIFQYEKCPHGYDLTACHICEAARYEDPEAPGVHCNSCDTWHDCDVAMRCLNQPITEENGSKPQVSAMLVERLNYWRNHDLRSGWTGSASGPCCDKCRMTSPKDPLQALVGCRDPFQINCECHIPSRRAVREYMVAELEAILKRSSSGEVPRGQAASPGGSLRKDGEQGAVPDDWIADKIIADYLEHYSLSSTKGPMRSTSYAAESHLHDCIRDALAAARRP